MCGIISILRRLPDPQDRLRLDALPDLAAATAEAADQLVAAADDATPEVLGQVADALDAIDGEARRLGGLYALVMDQDVRAALRGEIERASGILDTLEGRIDRGDFAEGTAATEALNAALVRVKDALWALGNDRLRTAAAVASLRGEAGVDAPHPAELLGWLSIQQALSALDRLEVRGRDSAGLQLAVTGHGLDLASEEIRALIGRRRDDPLLKNGALRVTGDTLSFVYKTAAEIGELGDNVACLRASIGGDRLLRRAMAAERVEVAVLGHTRWASVGLINEPNAHPLDELELDRRPDRGESVFSVLNGDVDNYAELAASAGLRWSEDITTDAKVIPALVSRALEAGTEPIEAFRETVASFEGSVAIATTLASDPDRLLLALRGSGQALYVGLGDDTFIVASEPYGVIEETSVYLRLDGETPADPESPSTSRGQVVVLDRRAAGRLEGIGRLGYDGSPLPVGSEELQRAQITSRDVDRRGFSHFLLKEITEAPSSFAKTLRGKVREDEDGGLRVQVGDDVIPAAVREHLAAGGVRRILVIGQGTAAVAGSGVAEAIRLLLGKHGARCQVASMPATELSGFQLEDDMADTLIVAISQSGTTTDTNRTVDLVRQRGAAVIAIVNRRGSDLTDKADGVLYTSDGRDVEMSVASTKAFYSQIAGGFLLAFALAELLPHDPAIQDPDGARRETVATERQQLLRALRDLPQAMTATLEQRSAIGAVARELAPPHRYWALVGNGLNRIAAEEIRIKLSELCYKSIACDATEDKKHIDLSSEPLILVCAAGLTGSTASDVGKEVAIYAAHKATAVVIETAGEERFRSAAASIKVPPVHTALAFVLSAMVGHLFGYEAALAIDRQALPLRRARTTIERLLSTPGDRDGADDDEPVDLLARLRAETSADRRDVLDELRAGRLNGHLEASTAVEITSLFAVAAGVIPLDEYARSRQRPASPGALMADLAEALSRGIDELTRPIDAIKHQAKTVTVGISRADEALVAVPLVRAVLAAGAERERLSYADLRTLAALDPLIDQVRGFTRYRIDGDPEGGATVEVVARGGIATGLASRTETQPSLKGTKRRVATEGRLLVARGEADDRLFLLIPEREAGRCVALDLMHVELVGSASAGVVRGALRAYRNRWSQLRDMVTETEAELNEELLEEIEVEELLTSPIGVLARRWRERQPDHSPAGAAPGAGRS